LTLNVSGAVTQVAGNVILASGLQLLGSGTVNLDDANNDVATLAADYSGTISYRDLNSLVVGTVSDTSMGTTTTSGIRTSGTLAAGFDVKLTTGGPLTIGNAADGGADDIRLGTSGDLTLNVSGAVTQVAGNVILGSGLQLLGSGTVNLDDANNDVATLAADYSGTISYRDLNSLVVGTVSDTSMGTTTTSGIRTSGTLAAGFDVKLTTGGPLTIGNAADGGADDIRLGTSGDLTLNVSGAVTQVAGNVILGSGLQLLGSGTVNLDDANNDVATLAADYSGTISYRDLNSLVVGTVSDTSMGTTTTSGIRTSGTLAAGFDVKLTTGGPLTIGNAADGGADDIRLGTSGDLTLNVSGAVTQVAGNVILGSGLQLLGSGTVNLDDANNDVATLAADYSGTISYRDLNSLVVGTVSDTSMGTTTTSGIRTSGTLAAGFDVKLTTGGPLTIGNAADGGADDIRLGTSGDLTLNVSGAVTQVAGNVILGSGLQLLGSGTVNLDDANNDVATLAADYSGTISYRDLNSLVVGTVSDTSMGTTTTSGIRTSGTLAAGFDVKLTTGGPLTIGNAADGGADDIRLGTSGDLTLNVSGAVTQVAGNVILGSGLQLLGSGTVNLDDANNDVATLAADYSGTISYRDLNSLVVGTVSDTSMGTTTSSGIRTSGTLAAGFDVKLTTGGPLTIGNAADGGADDIRLGTSGDLTLNVSGAVTQVAGNMILGSGLQLLGSGTVNLDDANNDVATLAADYSGTISYRDLNSLVVGTVTDTAMTANTTTSGIVTDG